MGGKLYSKITQGKDQEGVVKNQNENGSINIVFILAYMLNQCLTFMLHYCLLPRWKQFSTYEKLNFHLALQNSILSFESSSINAQIVKYILIFQNDWMPSANKSIFYGCFMMILTSPKKEYICTWVKVGNIIMSFNTLCREHTRFAGSLCIAKIVSHKLNTLLLHCILK